MIASGGIVALSGFIAYCGALALAAIIPGPQLVAIVAQALRAGYRQAIWITIGMVAGDVLYLAAVLAGLAYLAETFSTVLIAIKWAGVAYLIWLGVHYWRSGIEPDAGQQSAHRPRTSRSTFVAGVLVTLGNPKSVLFYIALLPTIIDLNAVTLGDGAVLLALTAAILTLVQLPFALAGSKARDCLRSPRALRRINRGAALFMGGAAATIAARN
jgi:threonine/homoserine/homoserine lactone efflux protein